MYYTFLFLLFLSFLKNVYSVIYILDLDDREYMKLCNEVKSTPTTSTCTISFKSEDNLDIYQQNKKLWSSQKHHKLKNLVILSKSGKSEVLHLMYQDLNTEKISNVYFHRKEEDFVSIERDEYYKICSMIRDMTKVFDVNIIYDDWYLTIDDGIIKTYHFEPTTKVLRVVDGKNLIWNNEKKSHVAAVKIKYGDEGPENCEIFLKDKLTETRHLYIRDDLGWHFINTAKSPIEESKLKIPSIKADEDSVKDQENKEGKQTRKRGFKHHSKYELIISLDDRSQYKLPNYVDAQNYKICGFNSRIYDCNRATVTRVSDGFNLLWHKSDNTYLEKVSLYQCTYTEQILLELEYVIKRDRDLGPIKGLKNKNWMNRHYYEYDYYVKRSGVWYSMSKVDFIKLRQTLVQEYILKNVDKSSDKNEENLDDNIEVNEQKNLIEKKIFDKNFEYFFNEVHETPLETLKIRRNICYDSFNSFWKSFVRRFFKKEVIPITYDLKNDPNFIFTVMPHTVYQNFLLCVLDYPYALTKISDGDQVIWSQGENGLGVMEMYYFASEDLHLLHFVIDAKHETNKYYHKRKGYWYEIEQEEHIELLNENAKTYKGKKFAYQNKTYVLIDEKE